MAVTACWLIDSRGGTPLAVLSRKIFRRYSIGESIDLRLGGVKGNNARFVQVTHLVSRNCRDSCVPRKGRYFLRVFEGNMKVFS